jgi:hypothetical protein
LEQEGILPEVGGGTLELLETLTAWSDRMLELDTETLTKVLQLGAKIKKLLGGAPADSVAAGWRTASGSWPAGQGVGGRQRGLAPQHRREAEFRNRNEKRRLLRDRRAARSPRMTRHFD